MADSLKRDTVRGVVWSAVERFSVQGVQFFVMLVMARLLLPADYGLLGMLTIFITVSYVFIDAGFTSALIRKQNRTQLDNSTVFYFNVVLSLLLYILLWVASPFIADFYDQPLLSDLMRVVGLSLVINSFVLVPRAILTADTDFKTQTKASLIGAILSGSLGIFLAYRGCGVWSLVWQQIANAIISSVIIWILCRWRPTLEYSWQSFKELFGFGSKLLLSSLLDKTWSGIYPLVVGKVYSAEILGYYSRAHHFSEFPSSNVTAILQRVTYPILCRIQDDPERLPLIYRRFIRTSVFVIFPLMLGLSACSAPMINILIGEKWAYCSVLLTIICFSMMWYPMQSINLNLLQVKGRSDLFLRLEIIKKIMGVIVLCISVPLGIEAMCYAGIVSSLISLIINTYYTGKLIDCGFLVQMKDIAHILLLSLVVWGLLLGLFCFIDSDIVKLCVGIPLGMLLYVGVSLVLKFPELDELLDIVKKR